MDVVTGDAADAPFAARAARGATAVYQTLNPSYHRWAEEFPPLQRAVLAAAEENQARFVNMDNVYSYGRPAGAVLREDSPTSLLPQGRDPAAHGGGGLGRPRGRASRPSQGAPPITTDPVEALRRHGDRVLKAAVTGTRAALFGDPDLPHSYTYIPDGHRRGPRGARHDRRDQRAGVAPAQRSRALDESSHGARAVPPGRDHSAHRTPSARHAPRRRAVQSDGARAHRDGLRVRRAVRRGFDEDIADLGVAATPIATALAETMEAYRAADAAPGSPGPGASDRG